MSRDSINKINSINWFIFVILISFAKKDMFIALEILENFSLHFFILWYIELRIRMIFHKKLFKSRLSLFNGHAISDKICHESNFFLPKRYVGVRKGKSEWIVCESFVLEEEIFIAFFRCCVMEPTSNGSKKQRVTRVKMTSDFFLYWVIIVINTVDDFFLLPHVMVTESFNRM